MPRPTHYSPCIDRFLVKALYHEAKRQGKPMTVLADELVYDGLKGSDGWRVAEAEAKAPQRFLTRRPPPQPKNDP